MIICRNHLLSVDCVLGIKDNYFLLCTKNSKCFSVCPCDKRFRLRAPSQRSPEIRQMSCFPITQQNEHSTPRGSFFSPPIPAPEGKRRVTSQWGSRWAMGSKVTKQLRSAWGLRAVGTRGCRHHAFLILCVRLGPHATIAIARHELRTQTVVETASGFWDGTPGQARAPGITGILCKGQPLGLRRLQVLQKTRMSMLFLPKNEAQFNVIDNHFLSCPTSNSTHLPFLYWHLDLHLQWWDPGLTSRTVFIKGACVRRDEGSVQSSDSVFSGWRGRKAYQETVWQGERREYEIRTVPLWQF